MNISDYITTETPTIIEAGAAMGEDTVNFSNLFPKGKIYSFEPSPKAYSHTYQLVKDRPNVDLYNNALGERTGEVLKMNISDRFGEAWGSSSILSPKEHLTYHGDITFKETVDVKIVNLDDFIRKKNIKCVDFLWLDLQGYEPLVLKSSPELLKITKHVYTEVNLIELYDSVMLYPAYKEMMESKGYSVILEELPWKDAGNVLFKNNNF